VKDQLTEYVIANAALPVVGTEVAGDPPPDAIHVRDGRIRWVGHAGSDDAPVDRHGRSNLPVYDLGGKTVLPGFMDNHVHTLITGDHANRPSLHGLDAGQIRETVRALVAQEPGDTLLFAYGWDYPTWPDPHKRLLDEISSTRPIALFQFSGHAACVNSAMLRRLGITKRSTDRPGAVVERDGDGEPTGILREGASRVIHEMRLHDIHRSRHMVDSLLRTAQAAFVEHGITSVGDNTWYAGSALGFTRLRDRGELRTRVSAWSRRSLPYHAARMAFAPYDRELVRRGPVKDFLDGAFSSYSALLLDPYAGNSAEHGTPHIEGHALRRLLGRLTFRGRQGAFHAIGDGAVRNFVDAAEAVAQARPKFTELRHRLEHCQLVAPEDIERLANLGILAAVQPHAISSPEKDREILGSERAARAYPYRSLLEAGVPLSFGSDSPAEATFAPLEGIRRAVLRSGPERLTVRQAVDAYTRGSAYAEGTEEWKGAIAPGYAADFVVLSHDPLAYDRTGDETPLRSATVETTIMNGGVVFQHEDEELREQVGR